MNQRGSLLSRAGEAVSRRFSTTSTRRSSDFRGNNSLGSQVFTRRASTEAASPGVLSCDDFEDNDKKRLKISWNTLPKPPGGGGSSSDTEDPEDPDNSTEFGGSSDASGGSSSDGKDPEYPQTSNDPSSNDDFELHPSH